MKVILRKKNKHAVVKTHLIRGNGPTSEDDKTIVASVLASVPTGLLIIKQLPKYKGVIYIAYDMLVSQQPFSNIVKEVALRVGQVQAGETATTRALKLTMPAVGQMMIENVPLSEFQIFEYESGIPTEVGIAEWAIDLKDRLNEKINSSTLKSACEVITNKVYETGSYVKSSVVNAAKMLANYSMQTGVDAYLSNGKDGTITETVQEIEPKFEAERTYSLAEVVSVVSFLNTLDIIINHPQLEYNGTTYPDETGKDVGDETGKDEDILKEDERGKDEDVELDPVPEPEPERPFEPMYGEGISKKRRKYKHVFFK